MKQKLISITLALLILMTSALVCFADGYGIVLAAKSDFTNASKGETFSVSFYTNSISDSKGILGITADIVFNPSHLKLLGVEAIVPSTWGTSFFAIVREANNSSSSSTHTLNMSYDGNVGTWENAAVRDDFVLGFEVKFSVETDAKTKTTIEVPTESIEAVAFTDIASVPGLGESFAISLNSEDEPVSEESSYDPFYSIDPNVSYEEPVSSFESSDDESATDESDVFVSAVTSEETSAGDVYDSSEISSEENISKVDNSAESGDESQNTSENSSSEKDKEGGVNIIFWLVIACIIVAAIAVGVYVVKNKKDDMNPVNPG